MHAHALEMLKDHLYEGAKALDVGSGIICWMSVFLTNPSKIPFSHGVVFEIVVFL